LERPTLDFPTAPEMSRNFNPKPLFPSRRTERIIQLERSLPIRGNCRWNPVVLGCRQTTVLYVCPRQQIPTRGHFVVQDGFCKSHLVGPFARPDIQEVLC